MNAADMTVAVIGGCCLAALVGGLVWDRRRARRHTRATQWETRVRTELHTAAARVPVVGGLREIELAIRLAEAERTRDLAIGATLALAELVQAERERAEVPR